MYLPILHKKRTQKVDEPLRGQRLATLWHTQSIQEILETFQVKPDTGLQDHQIKEQQAKYGSNILPLRKAPSLLLIFLHQFKSPLIYILMAAGLLSLAIGDKKDAIFIFGVVLLNAFLGTIQEWKAEKSATALQHLMKDVTLVRRNRIKQEIPFEEVVPGDIVLLESGNRVPADLRLIQANNLSIDESLLTGESVAIDKKVDTLTDPNFPLGDRINMAFAGSEVTKGRGVGVVVTTGLNTEVGKIAQSVTESAGAKTPLILRMEQFTRRVGFIILSVTAVLAMMVISRGTPPIDAFFMAIALAVSAIPEGLPVAMTVALSIASQRMAKRNVIVRKLAAVEGLGSCTYIASDKTGTLTVNRQTVEQLALPDGRRFLVTGEGYNGEGKVITETEGPLGDKAYKTLERVAKAAIICNEGKLLYESGLWKHQGDAVDIALLAFGYKLGLQPELIRESIQRIDDIPYESERRYAASFYQEDQETRVAVKGAVETLLAFCRKMLINGQEQELDRETIERQVQSLSEEGYRVLAIADGRIEPLSTQGLLEEKNIPSLTLLGLICMIDPLRPEALPAVQRCQQAGVQVAMVTGDHPATSLAIAKKLGIAQTTEDLLSGQQLEALGTAQNKEFREKVQSVHVFARVNPLQKLEIVKSLIASGHFVAVTGDGVNDAPALRSANIGVAMGSGTDVAKDTAAIIVTDDNFATIQAGIEEGRFAYGNIRKVIFFLISNGAAELTFFLLAIFLDLPLPLLPTQILWVNLVTSGIQDIGLAFEKGEPDAMEQPPRKPTETIFNQQMLQQTAVAGLTMGLVCFGAWVWLLRSGRHETEARNLLLLLLVLLENYNAFNARSERRSAFKVPISNNYFLVFGVILAHGFHLLAMHLPVLRNVLQISPVSITEWLTLFLLASSVLIAMEIFKFIKRRLKIWIPAQQ